MTVYGFNAPGPDSLEPVRCLGRRASDDPCNRVLFEAPREWGVPTVRVLVGRERASGDGIVKHCPHCKLWVEILFSRWRAVA